MADLRDMSDQELLRMLRIVASPLVAELLRRGEVGLRVEREPSDGLALVVHLLPPGSGSTLAH